MNGLPPHDIDAEEAVLGSVLIDGEAIKEVAEFLAPAAFYSHRNKIIYEAALSLYSIDDPINQITLAQELARTGQLEGVGGAAYLSHLISIVPTSLDIAAYGKIVTNLSAKRQIYQLGRQISDLAMSDRDSETAMDAAQAALDSIRDSVNLKTVRVCLKNLRIVKTSPPYYILNVNDRDITMSSQEIQKWILFRGVVINELDTIPIKPKDFDQTIRNLMRGAEKIEAPVDASTDAAIRLGINRWFVRAREAKEISDLESGSFALVDYAGQETGNMPKTYMAFQSPPIIKWLKQDMGLTVTPAGLWSMMLRWGGIRRKWRVGTNRKEVTLWALPANFANGVTMDAGDGEPATPAEPEEEDFEGMEADDIPI